MTFEFDVHEIQEYFRIDKRISKIKRRIEKVKQSFYDQTLCSYIAFDGMEIRSVGFSVENTVIAFVDTLAAGKKSIEILEKRKRYLNDYLNRLEPAERAYLLNKYSKEKVTGLTEQADLDLLEEIHEINEAINFMYGFPAEFTGVPIVENSNLEDSFRRMAEMLGV